MTFDCTLTISGMDPQRSAKAFIDSYNETARLSHYQKYHHRLEQYFVNKIQQNIARVNIKDDKLKNSFSIDFKKNELRFISTRKNAIKYEYGSGNQPPKRYIQPAVFDTASEMSEIIIDEAINTYNKYSQFGSGLTTITPPMMNIQSNYFNKYSNLIK